ncbi:hypothetical protein [uncultured Erythrobacter sp.]|uniref:hypothetical protein n=1 Tax=uncultured Erythrobacter sp. TaxID=263913 RepID=UPI002628A9F2|nr:hypothetical protein [uncultured Erythrobacter sp.]
MNTAGGEVGKPLLISLLIIWFIAIALYFIIDPLLEAHRAEVMREYGPGPAGGISFQTLQPAMAIMAGVILSILFAIHWWLSGLFGKAGLSSKPIANVLLVAAGLAALLEIFEHGALDFFDYSLFCSSDAPTTVILVDEVYRCDRSLMIRKIAQWSVLLLPLFAIPVRIIESRLGAKKP